MAILSRRRQLIKQVALIILRWARLAPLVDFLSILAALKARLASEEASLQILANKGYGTTLENSFKQFQLIKFEIGYRMRT